MRKHNTARESGVTRKRAKRELTVGIDLGDRSSRYCMLESRAKYSRRAAWQRPQRLCPGVWIETAEPSGIGSGHTFSLGKSSPASPALQAG
jgi:hypothetical protein